MLAQYSDAGLVALPVGLQSSLDPLPKGLLDDGRMVAGIDLVLVGDLADVDGVLEDAVQVSTSEGEVALGV